MMLMGLLSIRLYMIVIVIGCVIVFMKLLLIIVMLVVKNVNMGIVKLVDSGWNWCLNFLVRLVCLILLVFVFLEWIGIMKFSVMFVIVVWMLDVCMNVYMIMLIGSRIS